MASALRDSTFLVATAGRSSPVKDTVALLSASSSMSGELSDSTTSSDSPGDLEMNSFGFGSGSKGSMEKRSNDDGWGSSTSSFADSSTKPNGTGNTTNVGSTATSDGWGSTLSSGRVYGGRYG